MKKKEEEAQALSTRVQASGEQHSIQTPISKLDLPAMATTKSTIDLPQALEESLHRKELECVRMETNLLETKRKAQTDKDALKKATQ